MRNPNKYSYKDGDKVVITQEGYMRLEQIEDELEQLYLEREFAENSDDPADTFSLERISRDIEVRCRERIRINTGKPIPAAWDDEFAIQAHLRILDSLKEKSPTATEVLRDTGEALEKSEEYASNIGKRKYPKDKLERLFSRLYMHPTWINMINTGAILESDLRGASNLHAQLGILGKKRELYYYILENRARIIELERKQQLTEYQLIRQRMIAEKNGINCEEDAEIEVAAWREMGLTVREIAKNTGYSKSKVGRILAKLEECPTKDVGK